VTLVDPTGQPIGGQLQAYADAAQVPTLAGTLIIGQANVPCPVACSDGPGDEYVASDGSLEFETPYADYGPAITWVGPELADGPAGEYAFDFELGHQFDWAYLTNDERQEFAAMWHDPGGQWWDSAKELDAGGEDGLERVFATDYASCAMGYLPQAAVEPSNPEQVCDLIDAVGQRVGAHMPPPIAPTVSSTTIAKQAGIITKGLPLSVQTTRHRRHRSR
jgi:hypothetical protein